jgi:GNAT superfamily N-acetyltransferase
MHHFTARSIDYAQDSEKINSLLLSWRLTQDLHQYPTIWRVRLLLTSRVWDPAQDAHLWENTQGQAAGLALLWRRYADAPYLVLEIFRHPDLASDALLEEMLTWGEQRAVQISTAQVFTFSLYASSATEPTGFEALLTQAGFKLVPINPEDHVLYMTRPLQSTIPPPRLPPGISLRPLTYADDLEAYQSISTFAKVNPGFLQEQLNSPEYKHLVIWDTSGAGLAYCECSVSKGEWQTGKPKIGWIDYMETLPDHQRKGLGMAALLAGLQQLKAWGVETAALATTSNNTAAVGLYEKAGFTPYEAPGPLLYSKEINMDLLLTAHPLTKKP